MPWKNMTKWKKKKKFKDLNSLSKILVYLQNNVILFKVQKKNRKGNSESCKDKKWKNNAYIKMWNVQ